MNATATYSSPVEMPAKRTLWLCALLAPLLFGPVWCFAWSGTSNSLGTATGLVLLLLLVASSVTDLSRRKIYNWATYSAAAWGLGLNFVSRLYDLSPQFGVIGIRESLFGFFGCFIAMLFAYSLARGGAGDVKLAAAIGSLLGLQQGLLAIAISYIIAGVFVLAWSCWCQGPLKLLTALGRLLGSMAIPLLVQQPTKTDKQLLNRPIPLAGFFLLGTLTVVLGKL